MTVAVQLAVNTTATITATFRNGVGALADPTVVTVYVTDETGAIATIPQGALTHVGLGIWSYAVTFDAVGDWLVEFDGDGAVNVEGSQAFHIIDPTAVGTVAPGTCGAWCGPGDLHGACTDLAFDAALVASRIAMATGILFSLTGAQWPGICTDTIRPCFCACQPSACTCGPVGGLELPGVPVVSIVEVLIDGVALAASEYRLIDRSSLVRVGAGWPSAQDLSLAASEPGTWQVTYEWGALPPPGGAVAAAVLACELLLAADPSKRGQCRLPQRVQTISRQGVTMTVKDDLAALFDKGRTGLPEVDLWLGSVLRGRERRRAAVIVPDQRVRHHRD